MGQFLFRFEQAVLPQTFLELLVPLEVFGGGEGRVDGRRHPKGLGAVVLLLRTHSVVHNCVGPHVVEMHAGMN